MLRCWLCMQNSTPGSRHLHRQRAATCFLQDINRLERVAARHRLAASVTVQQPQLTCTSRCIQVDQAGSRRAACNLRLAAFQKSIYTPAAVFPATVLVDIASRQPASLALTDVLLQAFIQVDVHAVCLVLVCTLS